VGVIKRQSGFGQRGVGPGSGVEVGVAFGEEVGRRMTGVGLGSGVGARPQAESIPSIKQKTALILRFMGVTGMV
jgi:hypothetical protein